MNNKKFSISRNNVRIFGKDFKVPKKPELDSRALAAAAAVSGVAAVATDLIPPVRVLSHVFKGAAAVAIGAADAKRIVEQDAAAANRKEHGEKIRDSVKKGKVRGRQAHTLTDTDYVYLSFLEDAQVEKLASAAQVEVLKTQIYLGLDSVRYRGITLPRDLESVKPGSSASMNNPQGLTQLKKERDQVRSMLDGTSNPAVETDGTKELKGLVRIGALETFNMILKKSGKYGKHLSKVFQMAEAAQVLKESGRLIIYPADKSFDSHEKFVDHLVERLEKSRKDSEPNQKPLLSYLPKLPGLGK